MMPEVRKAECGATIDGLYDRRMDCCLDEGHSGSHVDEDGYEWTDQYQLEHKLLKSERDWCWRVIRAAWATMPMGLAPEGLIGLEGDDGELPETYPRDRFSW